MSTPLTYRILIIDDTPSIHDDYRKVLCPPAPSAASSAVADLESVLFGEPQPAPDAPTTTTNAVEDGDPSAPDEPAPTLVVDSAFQGEEAAAMVRAAIEAGDPYAVAFVDMRMPPGWDGLRTIKELWKIDRGLQAVICTAYSDYSPDDIRRELGLKNQMLILRKPFDGLEVKQLALTLSEKWDVRRRRDILQHIVEASSDDLRRAALRDSLTGLPNRRLFEARVSQAIRAATEDPDRQYAVLFIDTDHFKVINDSLGHDVGDEVLVQLTKRIMAVVDAAGPAAAETVTAARLGGDEFAVVLDGTRSAAAVDEFVRRIIDASAAPYTLGGRPMHFSVSVGITTSAIGYARADEVVRDADTAMYASKKLGRGRATTFDRDMHDRAVARLNLAEDLRAAVNAGQIQVHYQPIVDISTGRPHGLEALARWTHPTRGPISPAEFIPVAEETGSVIPLGFHVLETACCQLAEWDRTYPGSGLSVSVNLSRKQLLVPDLARRISDILADTRVDPTRLHLEITESLVMHDPGTAMPVLQQIRDLNIPVHIDDFGTGHSSLSCLQTFPLNGLKIDRDFVREVATNPDQAAIVRAVANLAHSLKLPMVAEGIETEAQRDVLMSMGCDLAQGYLYAKPMPPDVATAYLASHLTPTTAAA